MSKIYVASSWRNEWQPAVVEVLRSVGHEVYDFRNPSVWQAGFQWSDIDPEWQKWTPEMYREALYTEPATRGFGVDWDAMEWADTGVLVLPSGSSSHMEAGYFRGAGKRFYVLLNGAIEPELMYRMAHRVCLNMDELVGELR